MEERKEGKFWYEYTAYPKIYKHCYWGSFATIPYPEVVENRNTFAREYDIKKQVKGMRKYYTKANKVFKQFTDLSSYDLDHFELYTLNNSEKLLAVISPYHGALKSTKERITANGWTEIYPLYTPDATTFIYYI